MAESHSQPQQIFVDRRPLWIVLFDRLRRYLFLALFFGIFSLMLLQDRPGDLSYEGYKVLCLFVHCKALHCANVNSAVGLRERRD